MFAPLRFIVNGTFLSDTRKCKLNSKRRQHFVSNTGLADVFHLGSGA